MERRLAAILAADVVGYSRLMQADEAGTVVALKARRTTILQPLTVNHRGRIVKVMGDGVLMEFASAVNAVEFAVELQAAMAAANAGIPPDRRIVLRVGINLGDVLVEGSDLYGDGVNIAARLETLADPGSIYVSQTVVSHVRGKVALTFDNRGDQRLKNMAEPVGVYRVRADGVPPMPGPAMALPDKPSIAVLPFQNLSGDPEQEYFADGVVEEIITALSRFEGLFVIARNSSFTYKGRAVDVKQVGRELGVRYVLEGSVRKAASKVRITGQLIDTATGGHLWADRIDGGIEDIFDLQDLVTASVVGAVAPKLEQVEIERARRKPTENLDAYDYFLRGMAGVHRWTEEGNAEALARFSQAIELDPDFAAAYGMAARCYAQRRAGGWVVDRRQDIAAAKRLAERAVELGRNDAVALATAGFALADVVDDLEQGDALIGRALALNPNLGWAWLFSGWVKISLGDPEAAIERVSRALRLSPNDPQAFSMHGAIASAHLAAGRYAEALSWAERAVRDRPNFLLAICIAAASAALAGRPAEAQKAMAHLRGIDPALRLANLGNMISYLRSEHFVRWVEGLRLAGLPE